MIRLKRARNLLLHTVARLRPSKIDVVRPPGLVRGQFEIGLAVTTYNRPEYVTRMFRHLAESTLERTLVVIVDDASSSSETLRLVRELTLGQTPIVRVFRRRRRGFSVEEALRDAWDLLADEYGCALLANIDSDTVMTPDWLQRITELFRRERSRRGPLIVTGFNSELHESLSEEDGYCIKSSIGGINMLFDAALYADLVRSSLIYEPMGEVGWDWYVVARMRERGYPFLCTRPSVIQHIGAHGRFSLPWKYDVANDYEAV